MLTQTSIPIAIASRIRLPDAELAGSDDRRRWLIRFGPDCLKRTEVAGISIDRLKDAATEQMVRWNHGVGAAWRTMGKQGTTERLKLL